MVQNRTTAEEALMADKLGIGASFPGMTMDLVSGGTITLPDSAITKYGVVLFYRGHW